MALAGLLTAASFAAAQTVQTVPLPPPAPPQKGNPPARQNPAPVMPAPPSATASNPQVAPYRARPGETLAFDANQRALADRVSMYLSSVQSLIGNFVQVGPDGSRTQGEIYVQKPGRMRFEYDAPSPIDIVADGQSVVVRDRKLATQDVYPLSQTPLRFLLSDRIDLLRDTHLIGLYADDVFVTVVIEEKQPLVGTNRLMLMFSAKDLQLKQWTVTDAQGYDTTVAVYNLDSTKRPDPSLFKIDYTQYRN
jgi:outer membrane lipoprotein-sorting protein